MPLGLWVVNVPSCHFYCHSSAKKLISFRTVVPAETCIPFVGFIRGFILVDENDKNYSMVKRKIMDSKF